MKPHSTEISQHKHCHLKMINKQRDYKRPLSSMPSSNGSKNPEVQLIFAAVCVLPTEKWVRLQTAFFRMCLMPDRWGYLQIASRASKVRLMSRICAARVCMGCMERSNSSQRAISVYMPCGIRS